MKTTVYIPCIDNHFEHVFKTVEAYKHGTAVPEELIVFASGMKNVSSGLISSFKKKFPHVKLVCSSERVCAGPARQAAKELATGDIIIYQDADDLPHRRRVQFIKHFFTIMDVVSVHHSYLKYGTPEKDIDLASVKAFVSNDMYNVYFKDNVIENIRNFSDAFGGGYGIPVHAGVPSIRKEVLNDVKWKSPEELTFAPEPHTKTEDYQFSSEVWFKWNKSIIIDAKIYFYK